MQFILILLQNIANMKTIAVDMDHVIADVESHWIDWYEKEYGVKIRKEDIFGVLEKDAFPVKGAIERYLFSPGFFRTAPVMPGAQEALQNLQQKFDIYIVSAAMEFPQSLNEKREWMSEHFPFISWRNIIFCGNKSIIDTDYMIDDHLKNLQHCKGKGIMFTAFHNAKSDFSPRVNNWKEAETYLNTL